MLKIHTHTRIATGTGICTDKGIRNSCFLELPEKTHSEEDYQH